MNDTNYPSLVLSENSFEQLKSNFQPPFLSRRRVSVVSNVYDLITQLHKQHQLNIDHINSIKQYLNSQDQHVAIDHFRSQLQQLPADNYTNLYAEERRNSNVEFQRSFSAQQPAAPTSLQNSFDHNKNRVYKIVAQEIGKKWRELGRELSVPEGEMDRIQERYRDDIHSKMYAIFELFESRTDCRDKGSRFCEALKEVRRTDLAKRVSHIFIS